ncbi:unnamed protein product [Rotaria socialis]|uniref:Neuroendocrine convertase 2 n=1 Tax=Rotaria socialis TaxID=392032 RepID=A0A821GNB1_9BILA|nr:unnamed protein product [Rotaria socialis]
MNFYYDLCILSFIFSTVYSNVQPTVTKDWLIEFHHHVEPDVAKLIAKRYAMVSRGPVLNDKHLYHFIDMKPTHPHKRKRRDVAQEQLIQQHELVKRAIHQIPHIRVKRGYRSAEKVKENFPQYQQPNDPYFQYQWYLKNVGQAGGKPRLDLNVEEAWALGYTGKNVTTAIMDDGLDYTHPDIMHNYNAAASYDFSSNDPYPYPRYTDDWFNSHGTRCAGEIAAARDNNICGVGVAYDSMVAGIRMLDQPFMTGVATTDLYGECTLKHSGTSAAAPEAAGVFALALEANRQLTWRDVQHLTVLTAKRNQLFDPAKQHLWHINGAGLEFNHLFGYGVLDAGDMVQHAKNWKSLPARYHCAAGNITGKQPIPEKGTLKLTINTDACKNTKDEVNYLEHVQAFITLRSSRRGNTIVFLTSPLGTRRRPLDDDSTKGFYKWPFMTTHAWAERAQGTWTLEVRFDDEDNSNAPLSKQQNRAKYDKEQSETLTTGDFFEWSLVLHGTKIAPYIDQLPLEHHGNRSKLFIAKQIHLNNFQDKAKYVKLLKQDNQKRLGSDDEIVM